MSGEELKNAIRGKGMTIEDAASLLGMSRQGLHYNLNKNNIDNDLLQKVKTKLGIHPKTAEIKEVSSEVNEDDHTYKKKSPFILRSEVEKMFKDLIETVASNEATVNVVMAIIKEIAPIVLEKDPKEFSLETDALEQDELMRILDRLKRK